MKINLNSKILWIERHQDKLMIALYLIFILFIGTRCSCNYHLKKAAQKCNKVQFSDTILVHDSILVDKITTDTIFSSQIGDTITITKDRLQIKYVKLPGDSVFISGKCDTVFVSRFIKVPYQKTVINHKPSKWQIFLEGLGKCFFWILICAIMIGFYKLWKFIN